MGSLFLGGIVGIALSVLVFWASAFSSSKILSSFKGLSVAIALVSFVVRLTLVGLVFYGLSRVKGIHFQAALLAFAAGFTACLILKAVRSYQKLGTMKPEPTESRG